MKKFNVFVRNYIDTDNGTITLNCTKIAGNVSEEEAFNMLQVIKKSFEENRTTGTGWYHVDEAACGSGDHYFVCRDYMMLKTHCSEVATMLEIDDQ